MATGKERHIRARDAQSAAASACSAGQYRAEMSLPVDGGDPNEIKPDAWSTLAKRSASAFTFVPLENLEQ